MSHNVLSILADVGLLLGLFFLPILWILYTDRFRRNPSPEQYASLFFVAAIVGAFLFLPAISIVACMTRPSGDLWTPVALAPRADSANGIILCASRRCK